MTLHNLLLRDWGTDLPIRGGYGGSREDPIIVTATDTQTVALTQMRTLHGIGRGRGVFWRTLSCSLLGGQWPSIEQIKIETKELTDAQIITQTENYYFDLSEMIATHGEWGAVPVTIYRDESGFDFPFEIGWMHFDSATNNEPLAPGLGITLQYRGPGVLCSIYVYDRGRTDIPDQAPAPVVREEFDSAVRDIALVNPDLSAWPDQPRRQNSLERYYKVGVEGREASLLCLTTLRGRFVKVRATWTRDHFIDHVANNFVDILIGQIDKFLFSQVGGKVI